MNINNANRVGETVSLESDPLHPAPPINEVNGLALAVPTPPQLPPPILASNQTTFHENVVVDPTNLVSAGSLLVQGPAPEPAPNGETENVQNSAPEFVLEAAPIFVLLAVDDAENLRLVKSLRGLEQVVFESDEEND